MAKGYRSKASGRSKGIQLKYTIDQVKEFQKCAKDPIYFIETYVKIIDVDDGSELLFKLRPYQKKFVKTIYKNRFTIAKYPRQSGKSTTVSAIFLHMSLFNPNMTFAILANKESVAKEILTRLKKSYELLPDFLKQGTTKWDELSVVFDNGSRIFASATSLSAIRGYSISAILLDEFAHIPPNLAVEFFTSVFPTISSGKKTKVIVTSTPKGLNHFYDLWVRATAVDPAQRSQFVPLEIKWNDVPGRDERFRQAMLNEMSLDEWNQEFECYFNGSTNTLLSSQALRSLVARQPLSSIGGLDIYEEPLVEEIETDRLDLSKDEDAQRELDRRKAEAVVREQLSLPPKIYNDLLNERLKPKLKLKHKYVVLVDSGQGKQLDYSSLVVFDVTHKPYKIVAKYRSNVIPPLDFAPVVEMVARKYHEAFVLVEIDKAGIQVANSLHYDLSYPALLRVASVNKKGKQLSLGFHKNAELGLNQSPATKRLGTTNLKTLVESRLLDIPDKDIIGELNTFVKRGETYKAEEGKHDDLAMNLVCFAWLTAQKNFHELITSETMITPSEDVPYSFIGAFKLEGSWQGAPFIKPNQEVWGDLVWDVHDPNGR